MAKHFHTLAHRTPFRRDDLVHKFAMHPAERHLYERWVEDLALPNPFVESVDPGSTYSVRTDIPLPQGVRGEPPPKSRTFDWSPSVVENPSALPIEPRFLKTGDSQWERASLQPDPRLAGGRGLSVGGIGERRADANARTAPDPNGLLAPEEQSGWNKFWSDPDRYGPLSQAALGMGASLLESSGPSRVPISTGQAVGRGIMSGIAGYGRGMAMLDARNQRKQQKTIADRAEEMWPYQRAVQKAEGLRAENMMGLHQNWGNMVIASGANQMEQQRLMQMGPTVGWPFLQKITARSQRIPLNEARRAGLPEAFRPFAQYMTTNEQGDLQTNLTPDLMRVLTDEQKAKQVAANKARERPFSLDQQALTIIQDRMQRLKAGDITEAQLRNDLEYGMAFGHRYGKEERFMFTNAAGELVESTRTLPVPNGVLDPRIRQAPSVSAQSVPSVEAQIPLAQDRVVSGPRPTTSARETKLLTTLQDVEKAKKMIPELRMALKSEDSMFGAIGLFTKTGPSAAKISGLTLQIQDLLKEMAGYGAPQDAELKRLAEMIHNPTDFDLQFYWKSGYDEKSYVLIQLGIIENLIKQVESTSLNELNREPAQAWGLDANGGDDEDGGTDGLSRKDIEDRIVR